MTEARKPKLDRRVQKTRGLLREALASLIREKTYDAITVTEILDRANVGRSTFYTHYRDKDELLFSGLQEFLEEAQASAATPPARPAERIIGFSLPFFEQLERHRLAGLSAMGSRGWAIVHRELRQYLAQRVTDDVRDALDGRQSGIGQMPAELLAETVAATFVLTLSWWMDSGSQLSAQQVNALFSDLILPTLTAATGT